MNNRLALVFQIASLVFSGSAFAAIEKGQHEGFLLDSRIKYSDASSHEVEAKVILNGTSWTLVAHTLAGNSLYGRTEKVAAIGGDASDETIRVLYREVNDSGVEVGASNALSSVGSPASIELKDAHIESLVSKIRYQID